MCITKQSFGNDDDDDDAGGDDKSILHNAAVEA